MNNILEVKNLSFSYTDNSGRNRIILDDVSLDFEEGIASEPEMSSIAHSVVVVRVKDGVDIEKTKQEIKEKVDPAKWICVQASSVIVESKDNVIILIMLDNNDIATKMQETFKNLD